MLSQHFQIENRSRCPQNKGFVPRPYQDEGIARGIELKRFINGDQTRIKKTASVH
jgi:hypothetical protein